MAIRINGSDIITDNSEISGLSQPLATGLGGTSRSSLTLNNVILGSGTNPVNFVAPGASGNVLTSNGTTWTSSPPSSGGGSGLGTMSTQNSNNVNITGGTITGSYTGINRIAAVFSHASNTGIVTTTHRRAVLASADSRSSGNDSVVIASSQGVASNVWSAVVASEKSTASGGRSSVLASLEGTASGNESVVIASFKGSATALYSAVAATLSSTASGLQSSVVASRNSTASGPNSVVISGWDSNATGTRSVILAGRDSTSSGSFNSVILGCWEAIASGQRSSVISSYGSSATGTLNSVVIASTRTRNNDPDSVVLGFGSSGSASTANRKIQLYSGNGNISYTGILIGNAPFTDFAEMMPNGTGAEISAGILLTLDNGAVRPANEEEEICGVVSHTAAILAGDTPFCWQGRYLCDEFGKRIYETILDPNWEAEVETTEKDENPQMAANLEPQGMITVLKENPNWNPELPQVPRSERPAEWTPVGMIGQVLVRTGEQVQAGNWISAKVGLGYKSSKRTNITVISIKKAYDGNYGIAQCLIK